MLLPAPAQARSPPGDRSQPFPQQRHQHQQLLHPLSPLASASAPQQLRPCRRHNRRQRLQRFLQRPIARVMGATMLPRRLTVVEGNPMLEVPIAEVLPRLLRLLQLVRLSLQQLLLCLRGRPRSRAISKQLFRARQRMQSPHLSRLLEQSARARLPLLRLDCHGPSPTPVPVLQPPRPHLLPPPALAPPRASRQTPSFTWSRRRASGRLSPQRSLVPPGVRLQQICFPRLQLQPLQDRPSLRVPLLPPFHPGSPSERSSTLPRRAPQQVPLSRGTGLLSRGTGLLSRGTDLLSPVEPPVARERMRTTLQTMPAAAVAAVAAPRLQPATTMTSSMTTMMTTAGRLQTGVLAPATAMRAPPTMTRMRGAAAGAAVAVATRRAMTTMTPLAPRDLAPATRRPAARGSSRRPALACARGCGPRSVRGLPRGPSRAA
jgi:hypothetical protein